MQPFKCDVTIGVEDVDEEKEERKVTILTPDDDEREKAADDNHQVEASIFPDDKEKVRDDDGLQELEKDDEGKK